MERCRTLKWFIWSKGSWVIGPQSWKIFWKCSKMVMLFQTRRIYYFRDFLLNKWKHRSKGETIIYAIYLDRSALIRANMPSSEKRNQLRSMTLRRPNVGFPARSSNDWQRISHQRSEIDVLCSLNANTMLNTVNPKTLWHNDLRCLLEVKGDDWNSWKSNISQMVRDREFVATEEQYKVPYRLSKKGEIFDWKVKSLTEILDAEYLVNGAR